MLCSEKTICCVCFLLFNSSTIEKFCIIQTIACANVPFSPNDLSTLRMFQISKIEQLCTMLIIVAWNVNVDYCTQQGLGIATKCCILPPPPSPIPLQTSTHTHTHLLLNKDLHLVFAHSFLPRRRSPIYFVYQFVKNSENLLTLKIKNNPCQEKEC